MTNSSSYTMSTHRWVFAIATLVVLVVVDSLHEILSHFAAYRDLYEHHAFYVPEGIDKIGGVILCALAVRVLRRVSWNTVPKELGLATSPLPAIVFALLASSPMLIGFALTRSVTPHIEPITILFLTMFSPIVEEIEFRGLGVRNLQRGTGWPFWITVWPQALLFGWGHVEQGQRFQEMAGLMLLTGSGAVVFAWLLYRWQSLWFPIALHVCMCAQNPVNECNGDLSPTAIILMMLPDLVTTPYKLDQEFGRQGTSVGNCAYLNSQPGMRKLKSPF